MVTDYVIYVSKNGGVRETDRLLPLAAARWAAGRAGGADLPAARWALARTPLGKPVFPEAPDVHASVTHSGEYWLCAIGAQPVGLDLQRRQSAQERHISRRFFHPEEDAFLLAGDYRAFFDVWAAKESFLKYTGEGFRRGMNSFSVVSEGALSDRTEGVRLRRLPFEEGYSLCLCAEEIGAVTFEALA